MSPEATGVIGIVVLLLLFMLKMPVAFTMAFVGFVGFAYLNGIESALTLLAQDIFETLSSYPLSVIPMFILMGSFAYASGISQRLYRTCYTWLGQYRGGLTVATVMACSGFAAICGSTAATAATMGSIALPEMKKYNYDDKLATGTVASAGTLGILIPPSTVLIIYGILTEESIGKLFIAGIVPGAVLTLFFVITVILLCLRHPELAPAGPKTTLREKIVSLGGIIEAILLFLLTIGGLFLGWFSPTQAGAVGACGAFLIGVFRKKLRLKRTLEALKDGLRTSCMVLYIITGAAVFGHFLAISNLPFVLADWVGNLPIPPMAIMGVMVLIYFVGGFFMDSMALIVVTIPIFFPIVTKFSFDPIWFGVIVVMVGEMGVITPPVGVNVFVIKGIAPQVPLRVIYRGIIPFLGAIICLTALLLIFPQIATFFPNLIYP
jgi:tripartite ATP-independent transporter DctM subunit